MGRLGEIFRAHGPQYRQRFAERMSRDQLRAMRDIEACHTAAAGKALWRCPRCGGRHFTFVGCGNRHCPACGATRAEQWRRNQSALLLPEQTYHLVTFTVPAGLRRTIRAHPRELLELLMQLSGSTLLDMCANPRWLGATPGLTALLHTWTRQNEYHPHVHCIGTGGGLDGQGRWVEAHPKFLVPVHALSAVFRARLRDAMREQYPELFRKVKPSVWKETQWVVHSEPVGTGETTVRYLSRYVGRVALSERAILHHDADCITLRYRKSGTNEPRTLRLEPPEFIRRFLQHVLPSGLHKIRHFGLHHSSKRAQLRRLQAALALRARLPMPEPEPPTSAPPPACPQCQAPMRCEGRVSARGVLILFALRTSARGPP